MLPTALFTECRVQQYDVLAEGALTPSLVLFLSACARFYENLRAAFSFMALARSVIEVRGLSALSQFGVRTRVPGSILNSNY